MRQPQRIEIGLPPAEDIAVKLNDDVNQDRALLERSSSIDNKPLLTTAKEEPPSWNTQLSGRPGNCCQLLHHRHRSGKRLVRLLSLPRGCVHFPERHFDLPQLAW